MAEENRWKRKYDQMLTALAKVAEAIEPEPERPFTRDEVVEKAVELIQFAKKTKVVAEPRQGSSIDQNLLACPYNYTETFPAHIELERGQTFSQDGVTYSIVGYSAKKKKYNTVVLEVSKTRGPERGDYRLFCHEFVMGKVNGEECTRDLRTKRCLEHGFTLESMTRPFRLNISPANARYVTVYDVRKSATKYPVVVQEDSTTFKWKVSAQKVKEQIELCHGK